MSQISVIGIVIFFSFYGSYYLKVFAQNKKGIKTNQLGKGEKSKKTFFIEVALRITTFITAVTQVASILLNEKLSLFIDSNLARYFGLLTSSLGVGLIIVAMITMRDSWRAGINNTQETNIVTTGIYQYSRNPAFVGFDLFYIGLALAFSNIYHILLAATSILLLHLQILEEEKFLSTTFGKEYLNYKEKVGRYFYPFE